MGDGFFKEFPVCFDDTGKSVGEVNRGLLDHGVFGGRDLSVDYPRARAERALLLHEVHTRADIDRLVAALREVLS